MSQNNPYRTPQSSLKPTSQRSNQGIWRDGKKLVVHKKAKLPPICVKTNEPSNQTIQRKFYWHHPAVFLAVLSPLIYIILALVLRKRHDLIIPMTDETKSKRRNAIIIGWVVAIASILLFVGSVAWMLQTENEANAVLGLVGILLAVIALIAGAMTGSRAATILTPKKMTESATWFSGADWEYLERFPQVPPNA